MPLPALDSIDQCASFSHVVSHLVPELLELPHRLRTVDSADALSLLYADTNPLVSGFAGALVLSLLSFFHSLATGNWSQVDRLWSIVPSLYAGHLLVWARLAGLATQRTSLACAFVFIWSLRLTFNFYRKGGYNFGYEDYRWSLVRKRIPNPLLRLIFSALFVSLAQILLLFAISIPLYPIMLTSLFKPTLSAEDWIIYALGLSLVFVEGLADQQQWDFQRAKHRYLRSAKVPEGFTREELDRGFVVTGLWAYSRHPNYLMEQTIWLFLHQWSCFACDVPVSWTVVGPLSLLLLFQGSTHLTETITAAKYSEYAEYQRQVPMTVPIPISAYKPPRAKPGATRASDVPAAATSRGITPLGGARKRLG